MSRERLPACCSTSLRTSTYLSAGSQSTLDAKRTSSAVAINLSGNHKTAVSSPHGCWPHTIATDACVRAPAPTPPHPKPPPTATRPRPPRTLNERHFPSTPASTSPLLSYPIHRRMSTASSVCYSVQYRRESFLPAAPIPYLSRGGRLERGQLLFQLRQKKGETADEGGGGGGQRGRDGEWPVFQDQPSSKN